jgi:hypothetical protein
MNQHNSPSDLTQIPIEGKADLSWDESHFVHIKQHSAELCSDCWILTLSQLLKGPESDIIGVINI